MLISKKNFCLCVLFVLIFNLSFSQTNYGIPKIKQHFDDAYTLHFDDFSQPVWDGSNLIRIASGRIPAMNSLLTMYEVTQDKAYLYKYMKGTTQLMSAIGDLLDVDNGDEFPYQGRVLESMARFVFLVKKKYPIASVTIYDPAQYWNFSTLGLFSDSLQAKVDTCLKFALCRSTHRWYKKIGMAHFANLPAGPAEMNFQAPWGNAFLFMGIVTHDSAYVHNAIRMASYYFGKQLGSSDNVLTYNATKNAYSWFEDGWQPKTTTDLVYEDGICAGRNTYNEDIGHGYTDITFPLYYNQYRALLPDSCSLCDPVLLSQLNTYFQSWDVARMRNTYTQNIYRSATGTYSVSVDGSSSKIYESESTKCNDEWFASDPNTDLNFSRHFISWVALSTFDSHSEATPGASAYSIAMNKYISNTGSPTGYFFTNASLFDGDESLANLTAAQWRNEQENDSLCFTMRNRHLVYDQDFIAAKSILVDTRDGKTNVFKNDTCRTNSFADPITLQREFTIESGVTSNFIAGKRITFKGSFRALAGSHFHAYLDALSGGRIAVQSSPIPAVPDEISESQPITAYPNPVQNVLRFNGLKTRASINIYSLIGSLLQTATIDQTQNAVDLNPEIITKHVFFIVKLEHDGSVQYFRILKE